MSADDGGGDDGTQSDESGAQSRDSIRLDPLRRTPHGVTFARIYLVTLFLTLVGGVALAVETGYLTPDLTITATVSVGTYIEYLVAGLVAAFLLFTFVQILRLTGVSFANSLISAIRTAAHNYESPYLQDDEDNNP